VKCRRCAANLQSANRHVEGHLAVKPEYANRSRIHAAGARLELVDDLESPDFRHAADRAGRETGDKQVQRRSRRASCPTISATVLKYRGMRFEPARMLVTCTLP